MASSQSQLKEHYLKTVVPALMDEFKITNVNRVPKLERIIVNTCMKEAVQDRKALDSAIEEMGQITGQKPVLTRARKSIANFKLREGMPLGCRVVLRRRNMYDFMLRLVSVALPRVRDFKGCSPRGFDGNGNYTMGLTEQLIFPEVDLDKVKHYYGMSVTFVMSAKTDAEGRKLLSLLGVPFRK